MKDGLHTLNEFFDAAQRSINMPEGDAREVLNRYIRRREQRRRRLRIAWSMLALVAGAWLLLFFDSERDEIAPTNSRMMRVHPDVQRVQPLSQNPHSAQHRLTKMDLKGEPMKTVATISRVVIGAMTALFSTSSMSAQSDLITNGSFEKLTAAGWTITGDSSFSSMASLYTTGDSAFRHTGAHSVKLTFGSGSSDVFQSIALPANLGTSVTLSFWLLMPTRGSNTNKWLQAQILQYESMPNCLDRLGYSTAITSNTDSMVAYDGNGEQYATWTKVTRTFTLDPRAHYLRLQFTTGNGSGGATDPLWIDDVSLVDHVTGAELIVNGGFEGLGAANWTITGDTHYPSMASLYMVGDAAYVYEGTNSARLTFGAGSSDVFQTIVLPPDVATVRLSFWVLMPTRGSGENKWLQAQILQYDSMPNYIDRLGYSTAITSNSDSMIAYDGNGEQYAIWTRITKDFKIDPRARFIRLQFTTGNGSGGETNPLWIDSVSLAPIRPSAVDDDRVRTTPEATVVPNPATRSARLDFTAARSGRYRVVMYTVAGEFVATLLNEGVDVGRCRIPIDISRLSSGTYHVAIIGGGRTQTVALRIVR